MLGRLLMLGMMLALWGCGRSPTVTIPPEAEAIAVESVAFAANDPIPLQYTCDGGDISPPLTWSGVPDSAQSLVLIMDDPDAPGGTFIHWVAYNLPADLTSLNENIPDNETLVFGGLQGKNGFRSIGYGGPCPPSGTHRYVFKLYAIDTVVDLDAGASVAEVLRAIAPHIVGFGSLTGVYARSDG